MKYAIIGTGAVGSYYGGKLAHAGYDVHFLLHSDYEYVNLHGMQIDSCEGSFHLDHPQVYHNTEDMPKADVVIVALKTTRNHLLKELLQVCTTFVPHPRFGKQPTGISTFEDTDTKVNILAKAHFREASQCLIHRFSYSHIEATRIELVHFLLAATNATGSKE